MSYVALATERFDDMTRFYGDALGFRVVREWDRAEARGCVFDIRGLHLELLDATRERHPMTLTTPDDRVHLVVEVEDVQAEHRRLHARGIEDLPSPVETAWGARLFRLQDPDGISVTVLEWTSRDT